jgi:hypothetical protein
LQPGSVSCIVVILGPRRSWLSCDSMPRALPATRPSSAPSAIQTHPNDNLDSIPVLVQRHQRRPARARLQARHARRRLAP